MEGCSVTMGINIIRLRSDTFWLKAFVNTNLKNILDNNFQPGTCNVYPLLINLEYNNNLTQNNNAFQINARNLFCIGID